MENYSGKRLVIVLVIVAILLILSFIFFGRDDGGSVEAIHPIIGVILT